LGPKIDFFDFSLPENNRGKAHEKRGEKGENAAKPANILKQKNKRYPCPGASVLSWRSPKGKEKNQGKRRRREGGEERRARTLFGEREKGPKTWKRKKEPRRQEKNFDPSDADYHNTQSQETLQKEDPTKK